jgi:hypothetical protein
MAGKMGKAEKLMLKGLKDFQKKGLDFKPKEIELDPELKKIADMMGKKIQKKRFGGKVKNMQLGGDPTGNRISDADMARLEALMGQRPKINERGNTVSDADLKKLKRMLQGAATAGIGKSMIQGKEMGGEVMDMTKAQPVGMMDGGKVKKMNMGGVIGGRGGNFKGMR